MSEEDVEQSVRLDSSDDEIYPEELTKPELLEMQEAYKENKTEVESLAKDLETKEGMMPV